MGADLLFHRVAGRTLFSRLGAESAGTLDGAARGAGDRVGAVRTIALQQTLGTFQLAVCVAGRHRGDVLRAGVARTAAGAGVYDYPCQRRLDLGTLVLRTLRRVPLSPQR